MKLNIIPMRPVPAVCVASVIALLAVLVIVAAHIVVGIVSAWDAVTDVNLSVAHPERDYYEGFCPTQA